MCGIPQAGLPDDRHQAAHTTPDQETYVVKGSIDHMIFVCQMVTGIGRWGHVVAAARSFAKA